MRWAWKLVVLAALLALGAFDLDTGIFKTPRAVPWVGSAELLVMVLAVVAWFWPSLKLSVLAAVGPIALTVFWVVSEREPNMNWGLVKTAALCGVLLVSTLRARSWWQAPIVGLVAVALATLPLRNGFNEGMVTLMLALTVIAVVIVAGAGYLRMLDTTRARQVATVRAEQRAEFARDLHDFVAHHVTGIVVLAQGARLIVERSPQAAGTALEKIEQAGGEAMIAMRRMVGVLRTDDAPLAPLGGIPELVPLVEGFERPPATLKLEGPVDDLPVEVTSSVYRVVMEALTNVRRHASEATAVDVSVRSTEDWVLVKVVDDGRVSRMDGKGFGLLGLTERVQALGGRIKAGPGIDGGWVVDAALPVARMNA